MSPPMTTLPSDLDPELHAASDRVELGPLEARKTIAAPTMHAALKAATPSATAATPVVATYAANCSPVRTSTPAAGRAAMATIAPPIAPTARKRL